MRVSAAACLLASTGVALSACGLTAGGESAARSGPFATGAATSQTTLFGDTFAPCSELQLEAYPSSIDQPSGRYYAGPWCRGVPGGTTYVWSYGRPLSKEQDPRSVREDVNRDVLTLVSDLKAQKFVVLCGPHADDPSVADVDIGLGKVGEKTRIYLSVRGQDLPPAGSQAPSSSATPLSLTVTRTESSPVPADVRVAPRC